MPAYPFTHARVLFLSAAGGLTLSACAAGNNIKPRLAPRDLVTSQPGATIAAAAARDAHMIDRDHWWQSYGDPQLDTLISAAGEGVPSIDAAIARLARAAAGLDVVRSDRLPRVTGSASASGAYFPDHPINANQANGASAHLHRTGFTLRATAPHRSAPAKHPCRAAPQFQRCVLQEW